MEILLALAAGSGLGMTRSLAVETYRLDRVLLPEPQDLQEKVAAAFRKRDATAIAKAMSKAIFAYWARRSGFDAASDEC